MAFDNKEFSKLDSKSQSILKHFLSTYSESSASQVRTTIRSLIKQTEIYKFEDLTYEDFTEFKAPPKGNKKKLITNFFRYLYSFDILKNTNGFEKCYWDKEKEKNIFLDKISSLNKDVQKISEKFLPALTMEELERLILFEQECITSDDDYFKNKRLAFCFYLLFYHDLKVATVRNVDAKDFNNGILHTKEKDINIPQAYWNMLEYLKKRQASKFSILDIYIKQLGNIVGIENLLPNSILSKKEQSTFPCPECGKNILAFSKFWKSVNGMLVCNICAERLSLSGKKKINDIDLIKVNFFEQDLKDKINISNSTFENLRKKIKFPTNYIELHKFQIHIGELGEKFVYEYERERLIKANSNFAEMVDATPANNPINGFDILSYTENGEKIFIEVKATTDNINTPFYMSQHELDTAKSFWNTEKIYQIHRIYNIMDDDVLKIGHVIYDSLDNLNLKETTYRVEPK